MNQIEAFHRRLLNLECIPPWIPVGSQYASIFLPNGGLGNYATTANLSDASASLDLERTAQDASVLHLVDLNSTTKRAVVSLKVTLEWI
jgi:hypothetical protein